MKLSFNTESPDSIHVLLKKVKAISTVNSESLGFIESRKGQKVVSNYRYTLEFKAGILEQERSNSNLANRVGEKPVQLRTKRTLRSVDEIINTWRYSGEPLAREDLGFEEFINRRINKYEDLVEIHFHYENLIERYTKVLTDALEARQALRTLLINLERLQVAIGEIHSQTIDEHNSVEGNRSLEQRIKDLSNELKQLQQQVPNMSINLKMSDTNTRMLEYTDEIPSFDNCDLVTCSQNISVSNPSSIIDVQNYSVHGNTFLACALADGNILLWDVENKREIGNLLGHRGVVKILALFHKNGVPMLASGGDCSCIKLWNLQDQILEKNLSGHKGSILSLTTYQQDNKTILISGGEDKMIRLYDLDENKLIQTLVGHSNDVHGLKVFYLQKESFLASTSSNSKTIKIWALNEEPSMVSRLSGHRHPVYSLATTKYKGNAVLASGDARGCIKLWDLQTKNCVASFEGHASIVFGMKAIHCNGQFCLASGSVDGTIKIWNLDEKREMITLYPNGPLWSLTAFVNNGKSYIASGHISGKVKLWSE